MIVLASIASVPASAEPSAEPCLPQYLHLPDLACSSGQFSQQFPPKKTHRRKNELQSRVHGKQAPTAHEGNPFCGLQFEGVDTSADLKAAKALAESLIRFLRQVSSRQVDLTEWRVKVCPRCRFVQH
jgi:hypothetical protein